MTTIAWDGTTLAGDTLGVIGGMLAVHAVKIFQLVDGRLYGGSGNHDEVLAVRDWLNGAGDKPAVKDFAGIIIGPAGACVRVEEALVAIPITEAFHAVGSGRDFAMAAMALGQTACQAVTLAAQWDIWTGGDIMCFTLSRGGEHAQDRPAP